MFQPRSKSTRRHGKNQIGMISSAFLTRPWNLYENEPNIRIETKLKSNNYDASHWLVQSYPQNLIEAWILNYSLWQTHLQTPLEAIKTLSASRSPINNQDFISEPSSCDSRRNWIASACNRLGSDETGGKKSTIGAGVNAEETNPMAPPSVAFRIRVMAQNISKLALDAFSSLNQMSYGAETWRRGTASMRGWREKERSATHRGSGWQKKKFRNKDLFPREAKP